MASGAHRAWVSALVLGLVLGLTPRPAGAAPPDPETDPEPDADPAGARPRSNVAPPIVVGSVALASLTTAIVFTARSARASRSLAADLDARVQYDQDDRRLHQGPRDAVVAASMFATTAVVGALVGALVVVCALRPVKPRPRSLTAGVGPHGGALVLTVGF